ncbi:hypothetical protein RHMOL_Rhmol01G0300500 [Rhododendron molle]|uniref:Uncharacterized protein n=1 Tax=Rhododendron molle TaxID=49168 RepID=A0ACC0Q8K0_RHOML|nr:hypothetical protein RHMOL_Rhmol01G0300500 [Rhododendron molle]
MILSFAAALELSLPCAWGGFFSFVTQSTFTNACLQPEHVMTFLLAELGTSGSLGGQQRLVVKGRFTPKFFEGILRRYHIPVEFFGFFNSCVRLYFPCFVQTNMSSAMVARVQTQFSQRRIDSSFSDVKSCNINCLFTTLVSSFRPFGEMRYTAGIYRFAEIEAASALQDIM